jgi:hypothetical protein
MWKKGRAKQIEIKPELKKEIGHKSKNKAKGRKILPLFTQKVWEDPLRVYKTRFFFKMVGSQGLQL